MPNHVKRLGDIEPSLLCKGHGICIPDHTGRERYLVGELCKLALTCAIKIEDPAREGLEQRKHGRHCRFAFPYDQRQGTVLRPRLAAGHWTVEGMFVIYLSGIVNIASELWRACCEVNEVGTLFRCAQQAVGGEVDIFDLIRESKHRENDVSIPRRLRRA